MFEDMGVGRRECCDSSRCSAKKVEWEEFRGSENRTEKILHGLQMCSFVIEWLRQLEG